jgi:hypothetical protein
MGGGFGQKQTGGVYLLIYLAQHPTQNGPGKRHVNLRFRSSLKNAVQAAYTLRNRTEKGTLLVGQFSYC